MLLPPMMKSISQKHVTDHRATYCYEPQRVILIIALQKISRLVFDSIENVQFRKIANILYTILGELSIRTLCGKKNPTPHHIVEPDYFFGFFVLVLGGKMRAGAVNT